MWLAEKGEYEQRGVCGLYASREEAMAAFGGKWTLTLYEYHYDYPKNRKPYLSGSLSNGTVDLTPIRRQRASRAATSLTVKVGEDKVGSGPWVWRDGTHADLEQWIRDELSL